MHLFATIANVLWSVANVPAYARFRTALRQPQVVQAQKLRAYLRQNAHTAFGKVHGFENIRSYDEFIRRVPLVDYESFEPWIARIRHGETQVVTHGRVTHLVPTSGSSSARKLIPFTTVLHREFEAAIGPWLLDLQRQWPGLLGGPAYWSITPSFQNASTEPSAVPVGFDTDTAYLGGARRRLAEAVMAVPPSVRRALNMDEFRHETLFHLLRCRELRLISAWHPSFLTLLLDTLPTHWDRLLRDIRSGRSRCPAMPKRAEELRTIGPRETALLWPELRLISSWGEGSAEAAITSLQSSFSGVAIQRKGLLATEAVVTFPFMGQQPLAVCSHFFEFLGDDGRVRLAHEICEDEKYEIVVTTGGGLWRYRLRDKVQVTGFVGETPALKFLGRTGGVSDRFGEKLSEQFVHESIREATAQLPPLRFALLAPDEGSTGCRYTLYAEGTTHPEIALRLDAALRKNPHYAWCRDLGQLGAPRIFQIKRGGFEAFIIRESKSGSRVGDVKPCSLSLQSGWSDCFDGEYLPISTAAPANGTNAQNASPETCAF